MHLGIVGKFFLSEFMLRAERYFGSRFDYRTTPPIYRYYGAPKLPAG